MARLPAPALEHEAAGRYIDVKGSRVFVRAEGAGMILLLAKRGLQSVSFDLPGLGLSGKPAGAPTTGTRWPAAVP